MLVAGSSGRLSRSTRCTPCTAGWRMYLPDGLLLMRPVHALQVSQEAAEVATKVKGSWGSGIAEEHIAWVPIVSGLREYAEASFPSLVESVLPPM
jgi:hypothetical protein